MLFFCNKFIAVCTYFFIYLWLKNKLKYFLAENLGQDYKNVLEVAKVSRIYYLAQLVEAYIDLFGLFSLCFNSKKIQYKI